MKQRRKIKFLIDSNSRCYILLEGKTGVIHYGIKLTVKGLKTGKHRVWHTIYDKKYKN